MFQFSLNGFPALLLVSVFFYGVIGPDSDILARTADNFFPRLTAQFDEEEIQDALLVSMPEPPSRQGIDSRSFMTGLQQDPVYADLYFDEGRSVIQGAIKVFLNQTVDLLIQEEDWRLSIEGHCDSRGSSAYNFARADYHLTHLATFLEMMGIQGERVHLVNFGQSPPACQEVDERCQEDNLRAERIFSILAVGKPQRGCLARIRLMAGKDVGRAIRYSRRSPYLQRIQVASPHFSVFQRPSVLPQPSLNSP